MKEALPSRRDGRIVGALTLALMASGLGYGLKQLVKARHRNHCPVRPADEAGRRLKLPVYMKPAFSPQVRPVDAVSQR